MSMINILNLTFSYEGSYTDIFHDVSFQIDTDWKLGFTGRNGRGKTTFLNLLLGKYPYSGTIFANVAFDYFPPVVTDRTQNVTDVIEEMVPGYALWQLNRELSLLDVAEDVLYRPFDTLSNGEQTKVLLAGLFLKDDCFLLIDEPTNHLDRSARAIVSDYLRSKKGFILVSHDRVLLDNCIDHILSINKTNIEIQKGNFSSWWKNKQLQDNFEMAENNKLQKDIRKLSAAAKQTAVWSEKVEKSKNKPLASGLSPDRGYIGHKAAKMMKRSKGLEARQQEAITKKEKLLKNVEKSDVLRIAPMPYHTERLAELRCVSLFYEEKKACGDLDFEILRGERIVLEGKNGSGKSSVLKLFATMYAPDYKEGCISFCGDVRIGSNLVVSYVPQDVSFLAGSLTDLARKSDIDESLMKTILRKLDFTREQFEKDMRDFSSGQKKKVMLAKSLCERAHLYIWDEPLNFIDVLSRMQIESLILEYRPTMLFVEHDGAFADQIATKTVML